MFPLASKWNLAVIVLVVLDASKDQNILAPVVGVQFNHERVLLYAPQPTSAFSHA